MRDGASKIRAAERALLATAIAYFQLIEDAKFPTMPNRIGESEPGPIDYAWHAARAAARALKEAAK